MRSDFKIIEENAEFIFLVDLNLGGRSVTNDIENVVSDLADRIGNRRLFYRDSTGRVDEVIHTNGTFIEFSSGNPFNLK